MPMKKTILLLLLLTFNFLLLTCTAQNLVPNPSFEQYSQCPDGEGEISYSIGWESYYGTPDYFNACASNPEFSVPYNLNGSYQPSPNGVAYAGFYAYWSPAFSGGGKNLREHIGRQLSSPLVIGTKYYVSFKVSMAFNNNSASCACNNIGIKFSTVSYANTYVDSSGCSPLTNNFAPIYDTSLISDTINWTTIQGSFVADSNYIYVVIGNFFKDTNTDTLIFPTSPQYHWCYSYYYVDDIYVSTEPENVIENDFETSVSMYPNPFTAFTEITIQGINSNENISIEIYDLLGNKKEVINDIAENNNKYEVKIKIERGNLSEGIYLLKIKADNKIFTNKLIIN